MSTTTTTERRSGRHPVNVGHLVMGIAFLAMVGVWALIQGDVVQGDDRLAGVPPGIAATVRESARPLGVPCGRHHWLTA